MSNPFDKPARAESYEEWYADRGRRADWLEKQLLSGCLADFPRSGTVLEVGCGTGHFTRWFAEQELRRITGDAGGGREMGRSSLRDGQGVSLALCRPLL